MKKSIMKKTLSILLSCFMLASVLMVGGLSAAADTEVLYSENFANATADASATAAVLAASPYYWSSWVSNSFGGTFRYDAGTGRMYLETKDTSGNGAFKAFASDITSGKVYVSFSFRKTLDNNNRFCLRIDTGSEHFYLGAVNKTLSLIENAAAETAVSTVGSFTDGNWHEVGFLIDLDGRTITGYADGVATANSMALPEGLTGITRLGFYARGSSGNVLDFTDILVTKVTGTKDITADVERTSGSIKLTFSEPIATDLTASQVNVKMSGTSDGALTVTSVTRAGRVLKIDYTGELAGGREYEVSFNSSAKMLFGDSIPPVYFTVDSEPVYTYLKDMKGTTSPSAVTVNSAYPNGVIDFENLTYTNTSPNAVTAPADLYDYIEPRNHNGLVVEFNNGTISDFGNNYVSKSVSNGTGNESGHAFRGWGYPSENGITLGKERPTGFSGIVVYEFDYYFPSQSGATAFFGLWDSNENKRRKLADLPRQTTAWTHFKMEYDFASKTATVTIGNNAPTTHTQYTASGAWYAIPDDITRMVLGYSSYLYSCNLYIDNFEQYFMEYAPTVVSVRYVDVNDVKSASNNITPATKAVEIRFSEDMDQSTLSGIGITGGASITGTSYNSETYTYTLQLNNLLAGNTNYVLSIPDTVTSAAGKAVAETEYAFSTTAGSMDFSGLKLLKGGVEFTASDLALVNGSQVTVNVDLVNTSGTTGTVALIYCFYLDDMLVAVDYDDVSYGNGINTLSSKTFTVNTNSAVPDSVKVFVWGDILTLTPLISAVEY